MTKVTNETDDSFHGKVLDSDIPVLVNFWAEWCKPCKLIAPVLEELADEYIGMVKVVKLDTEQCPNITSKYGIRIIPTLLLFNYGQVVDKLVGVVPKQIISAMIKNLIEPTEN
jgi:thioredoxin 1